MQVDLKTVAADFITKEVSRTVGATVDRATMVKGPQARSRANSPMAQSKRLTTATLR